MALIGPIGVPNEDIIYTSSDVAMKICKTEIGKGTLYITVSAFVWKLDNREEGISIPWPKISLHAISANPVRSVYVMLDFVLEWPGVYEGNANGNENENENGNGVDANAGDEEDEGNGSDASEPEETEIHLIPQDANAINQIFYAMNHCQSLHPDPNDSISEDDDFMEAEDEDFEEVGQGDMRNLHLDDEEKYADAEEN